MKKLIMIYMTAIVAANSYGVSLQLDNGMRVQTFVGIRPISESDFGVIIIDGDLLDGSNEHSGYLDGVIESTGQTSLHAFAGLSFPALSIGKVRRVTQFVGDEPEVPAHFKRFYRILNSGPSRTGTISFPIVDKGLYDERNGVNVLWILYGNNLPWKNNPVSSSPIVENVTIPAGSSMWYGIHYEPPSTTVYVKIFLEGPYRFAVNDPGHPGADYMATKLRYSPRTIPPNIHAGDCLIPVISPFADHRDSGQLNANNLPGNIVDWVYLQFRPGDQPANQGQEVLLANGYYGISCFLRHDGFLIDANGSVGVNVPGLASGNYYIIVASRNHLKVMSATAVATASLSVQSPYDFTTDSNKFYAFNSDRGIHTAPFHNKWLVAAGDGSTDPLTDNVKCYKQNHQIENRDTDLYYDHQQELGYLDMDYDMGSQVEGRDVNYVMDNYQIRSPFSWPLFRHDPERDAYTRCSP